jgi:hypothetical protein
VIRSMAVVWRKVPSLRDVSKLAGFGTKLIPIKSGLRSPALLSLNDCGGQSWLQLIYRSGRVIRAKKPHKTKKQSNYPSRESRSCGTWFRKRG